MPPFLKVGLPIALGIVFGLLFASWVGNRHGPAYYLVAALAAMVFSALFRWLGKLLLPDAD